MTPQERKTVVINSKNKDQIIQGYYIDLHPYVFQHGETIVKLRNQEKSRYNLNQKETSTTEGQNKWYDGYMKRNDDIYWCIYNKEDKIIGAIRFYNIKYDGSCCNQGSFIIDEVYAMSGPYALETEILTLDFVFDVLKINKVFNDNRVENKNMNSISKRIGFKFVEEFELDGARYNLYELTPNNYKKEALKKIFDKWRTRI